MLLVLVLVAAAGRCSCQADQAPAPAPAAAGAPAGPPMPSADQLNSQFAAAYNQDIIINSDLFADEPAILSGGLGFTNIIGVVRCHAASQPRLCPCASEPGPQIVVSAMTETMYRRLLPLIMALGDGAAPWRALLQATALNSSSEGVVRAANGTWRSNVTCASGQPPPTRVLTSASPTNMGTGGVRQGSKAAPPAMPRLPRVGRPTARFPTPHLPLPTSPSLPARPPHFRSSTAPPTITTVCPSASAGRCCPPPSPRRPSSSS